MANVVDFNMIVEINQLLKNKGIEYSIHGIGGCASCGLELRKDGQEYPLDKIVEIINEYLSKNWLVIKPSDNENKIFSVESKF